MGDVLAAHVLADEIRAAIGSSHAVDITDPVRATIVLRAIESLRADGKSDPALDKLHELLSRDAA